MARFLIIVNPAARRGDGARGIPAIRAAMTRLGADFELVRTERPGQATEIAQQAAAGNYEAVVVAGGDGTANEVVNGLMRAAGDGPTTVPLGLVPIGSGNDFAYMMLGGDLSIAEACQRLVEGQDKLVDVATATADGERFRYFVNGMGIGLDAQVGIETYKIKWLRGFPMYLVALLRTVFLHYNPAQATVTCDGQQYTQLLLMVSTGIGRRLGGGFHVTPFAAADDGLLDVCVAGDVKRLAIFPLIPRLLNGSHTTHPKCTMLRGCKITVSSQVGLPAHMDGEVYVTSAKHFEMVSQPARLWVRA
jgi:YegS/Rv2252/BmrU family lipid kinase